MSNLKKLRKIYRFFFPDNRPPEEKFKGFLEKNSEIATFNYENNIYDIITKHGIKLKVRDHLHSDYSVFRQIFNFEEFGIVSTLINLNFSNSERLIVIDSGANVGYTTLYLNKHINSKKMYTYAVEPSPENVNIFRTNVFELNNLTNVKIYSKALSHKKGVNYNISNGFRDGKDWSIETIENSKGEIEGITIDEIIQENHIEVISLLKIDIEGAERFIFNKENDTSFLNKTKILAIEIHDEYDIRESIYDILKSYGFFLLESGELTIGLNKAYI
ncbi:FkbM family methyltransferase [Seonamhaeicola marinus]|uniref:FkbM family methyltransferase n=1 Tax=Seonamhaeicola marinus TaxID=1912246 RepID=A0A5D0HPW7_9FLAO|nr:FkbM family methyltransferase [Seonamhaeicola marinus]TYA71412.1 FkbM family methyltransferase [Seonamhaeicola marinus]